MAWGPVALELHWEVDTLARTRVETLERWNNQTFETRIPPIVHMKQCPNMLQ